MTGQTVIGIVYGKTDWKRWQTRVVRRKLYSSIRKISENFYPLDIHLHLCTNKQNKINRFTTSYAAHKTTFKLPQAFLNISTNESIQRQVSILNWKSLYRNVQWNVLSEQREYVERFLTDPSNFIYDSTKQNEIAFIFISSDVWWEWTTINITLAQAETLRFFTAKNRSPYSLSNITFRTCKHRRFAYIHAWDVFTIRVSGHTQP